MAAVGSAYDYYLNTYGSQHVSRYDTHKKEDLKNTVNKIRKLNKESPLYKIKMSDDVQKYAIDIKENAKAITNKVASLSESEDGIAAAFNKKIAVSDRPDLVSVEYFGDSKDSSTPDSFEIVVNQLATPQANVGNYLKRDEFDFPPGSYSFDLNTNINSYEFQFNVNTGDTNEDVLRKLSRLVNNANIGLKSDVLNGGQDLAALRIESRQTGLGPKEKQLFQIVPNGSAESLHAMDTLGIQNMAAPAENSSFLLNGMQHSSYSNTFTINNAFSITLLGTTPKGQPVTIGFKPGAEVVADDVQSLVDSFNTILRTAENYRDSLQSNEKLLKDMGNVSKLYSAQFAPIGLDVEPNGIIDMNYNQLAQSIVSPDADASLDVLNRFKDTLGHKAEAATIDPMNYVNKVLVAYKNPGKNYVNPYETSIYSGMMLDRIC